MAQSSNEHKGHRDRMKEKFLNFGPSIFEEHELLEMLLYYAIPQKDTNPIAHRLLDRFGSLAGVMDAPIELLMEEKISKNTAFLLKYIPEIAIIYRNQKIQTSENEDIIEKIKDTLVNIYLNKSQEMAYAIFLNSKMKIISTIRISEGNHTSTDLDINKICTSAVKTKAKFVIISHNHPSGDSTPSESDIISTIKLRTALETLNVFLLDHFLIADDKCLSFYDNGYIYDSIEAYREEKKRIYDRLMQQEFFEEEEMF